jgi:hypothetical protein
MPKCSTNWCVKPPAISGNGKKRFWPLRPDPSTALVDRLRCGSTEIKCTTTLTHVGAVKRPKIAQRFSAGKGMMRDRVPSGTIEASSHNLDRSVVPCGTWAVGLVRFPALKRWAIFAEKPSGGLTNQGRLEAAPAQNKPL